MTLTIRDSIHTYIDFTQLESEVLDTRAVQRLRYIKQNAFAFYTYPTCQTNRFEHSLGVMKIGSAIIENLFNNSSKNIVEEFLNDFKCLMNFHCKGKSYYSGKKISKEKIVKDIKASVRLACLLHDVGHFPTSHLMETMFHKCLQFKFLSEENPFFADNKFRLERAKIADSEFRLKLHELTTALIVKEDKEFKKIFDKTLENKRVSQITSMILNPEAEVINKLTYGTPRYYRIKSVLKALRMILDSELDADKFDYLTRDSVNSGVASGDFDIQRILSTIVLYRLDQEDNYYYICPNVKSLSAVESFYIERTKAYNWFIFHHNCIFHNRLFSFILLKLMDKNSILYMVNNYKPVILPIKMFHYRSFNNTIPVNDIFLFEKIYKLYERFLNIKDAIKSKGRSYKKNSKIISALNNKFPGVNEDIERIIAYFEIMLFRKPKKFSLWKNISDYKDINVKFEKKFSYYLSQKNKKNDNYTIQKDFTIEEFFPEPGNLILNKVATKYLKSYVNLFSLQTYMLKKIKHDLNKEGVIFVDVVSFSPIEMDGKSSKLKLYCPVSKKLKSVSSLSPILKSLPDYGKERIMLFAFLICIHENKPLDRNALSKLREKTKNRFVDSLFDWLINCCEDFKTDLNAKKIL